MNKYTIAIKGMHCTGCRSLITMSLEDENFENIIVDENKGFASFDSSDDIEAVRGKLDKAFAELGKYSYTNLEEH